jgi:Flp pilus assembly protein TadG
MHTSKNVNCEKQSLIARLCSRIRGDKGNALLELALSVPILVLLLLGAVEFAQVEYASIEVSNAALAGVQYGAQDATTAADTTGIGNAAAADAPNITLSPTTATQACICSNGSASNCTATACPGSNPETILTVTTQATINPIVHVPGLPATYTVQGQAIQKVSE